jgi:hypothetical protein
MAGTFKGGFLRSYIFTPKELDVIQEYIRTGKRSAAFNKLVHYVRHNKRILEDVQIYLILLSLAHKKRREESVKFPPGRPSKLLSGLKGAAK